MDSVSSSSAFRIAGSKLAKAESPNFKGLFIANAVTLTTRVRIEILRALSTVLTSDVQEAFVKGFSSRPVRCIKDKSLDVPPGVEEPSTDPGRNYTFCEAVEKWGHTLHQGGLVKAYRKAKPAFNGCLEQYFVVLSDRLPEPENDIFSRLLCPTSSTRSFQPRGYRRAGGRQSRGLYRGRGGPTGANVEPSLYSNVLTGTRRDPAPKRGPSPDFVDEEPSKKEKTDD
jgi:hypothetical protein